MKKLSNYGVLNKTNVSVPNILSMIVDKNEDDSGSSWVVACEFDLHL